MSRPAFADAAARLFAHYGLECASRTIKLRDPELSIGVHEAGSGDPVVFVHGSGMSGATWAPVVAHLPDSRSIMLDLPGFGLSDPHSYAGRPLRAHAVAQLTSALDTLGLERAPVVGTSLGAMWALCLALDAPQRVGAVVAIGMPAAALPGLRADPFFMLMTTPGLGRVVARIAPAPPNVKAARAGMKGALGRAAIDKMPDEYFEAVTAGMRAPGWREAMWTHLNLAMRFGRGRPENALTDQELRAIDPPVLFIWGDNDGFGGPEIGRRATDLIPGSRLEVVPGRHAPFLDDPQRCAELIDDWLGRAQH